METAVVFHVSTETVWRRVDRNSVGRRATFSSSATRAHMVVAYDDLLVLTNREIRRKLRRRQLWSLKGERQRIAESSIVAASGLCRQVDQQVRSALSRHSTGAVLASSPSKATTLQVLFCKRDSTRKVSPPSSNAKPHSAWLAATSVRSPGRRT